MLALDEQPLIAEAQAGNTHAFEELIRRHERYAYNLAYRLTGNHDDASDALQDTLIRVYNKLPAYEGRAAFGTWLYRVVTNICLDQLRCRKSHASLDLIRQSPEMRLRPAEEGNPALAAERAELAAAVQAALEELPPEYRVAIALRDLYGYSYAEIEHVLGCNRSTLKSRLTRGRKKLRRLLTETSTALPV